MNESSGAGVNAGSSSVNLKFPASDSLSELVWSPHKGLSVKSAAKGGLADKRSFLLWNVGPSNVDPSASESIRCKGNDDDDKIVAANLVISQAELCLDSPVAPRASLTESPLAGGSIPGLNMESKDEMEEGKIDVKVLPISRTQCVHHLEVRDPAKKQEDYMPETSKNDAGFLIPNLSLQVRPDSSCDIAEAEASSVNLNKGIPSDPIHTNDNDVINCQILEVGSRAAVGQKSQCLDMHPEEVKADNEEEEKTEFSTHGGYMVPRGGKLEYTAENDLQQATKKDAYQQSEERLVRGCSLPFDTDAENHSSHFDQFKGKDKALSEGNVSRRFLDNEDDRQGSVESCNSACLLGKRRWNLSEQLMVDSKRMKNNIDIASTSMIRHDNSFMNWISNMIYGFAKVNEEDGPSLDLTFAHPTHEDTSIIREDVMCSRMQDPPSRNRGFQTVFQSLYCSSTKLVESGASENDCSAQGPRMQIDNTGVRISPVGLPGEDDVSCNHNFTSDENILPSTEDVVGQPDQALIFSTITPIQNGFKTDSEENKEPGYQECRKYKNGTSASVSQAHHKITMANNVIPPHAFDGRPACELSNKGKIFSNLWINRFSTKACSTSPYLDNSKKDDCPAIWNPDDFRAPNPQSQIIPDLLNGEKCPDISNKSSESIVGLGKELQTFAANTESSLGSKIMHEDSYQNHAEPAHKSRTSEAMASIFARRLDALRHIIPTVPEADSTSRVLTCFFCGKRGHNFQTCSEVTKTELMKTGGNKQKSNGKECSGNRSLSLSSNETQNQMNSNCMENKVKEQQNLSLISLVSVDIAEVPKGIFETMRRLQVSRADMLKWINSNVSLSHLEGLFLRLRLGKWEAGLGGTGYYVARITVENSGELLKDFKKSISVNVGGMKCLVGSQYISNHDFLEDELLVWWRGILKTGGEPPSKEDLDSRLKRRITLGF